MSVFFPNFAENKYRDGEPRSVAILNKGPSLIHIYNK